MDFTEISENFINEYMSIAGMVDNIIGDKDDEDYLADIIEDLSHEICGDPTDKEYAVFMTVRMALKFKGMKGEEIIQHIENALNNIIKRKDAIAKSVQEIQNGTMTVDLDEESIKSVEDMHIKNMKELNVMINNFKKKWLV